MEAVMKRIIRITMILAPLWALVSCGGDTSSMTQVSSTRALYASSLQRMDECIGILENLASGDVSVAYAEHELKKWHARHQDAVAAESRYIEKAYGQVLKGTATHEIFLPAEDLRQRSQQQRERLFSLIPGLVQANKLTPAMQAVLEMSEVPKPWDKNR